MSRNFDPLEYANLVEKVARPLGLAVFNYGSHVKGRDTALTHIGFGLSETSLKEKLEALCKTQTN